MNSDSDSCILGVLLPLWEFVYKVLVVLFVCLFRYIDGLIASWLTPKPLFVPWLCEQIQSGRYPGVCWTSKNKDSLAFPGSML